LAHALAARRLASRIAAVREAVGLAAYAAGDWASAIAELRTYHRMSGRQSHLAVIADCERALGRPERAIDLFRGADRAGLDKGGAIELLIVAAGARGDLGQFDAAVAMLQVRELTADEDEEWAARLRYAYADALLAANRREEAREWFSRAAAADEDHTTDAAERLLELDGVTLEDDGDDEDDESEDGQDEQAKKLAEADADADLDEDDNADDAGPADALLDADLDDPDDEVGDVEDVGAVVSTEADGPIVNDVDADIDVDFDAPDEGAGVDSAAPDADEVADEVAAVEGRATADGGTATGGDDEFGDSEGPRSSASPA
jgi:tetratricopeptide (TPR) repeat protein